MRVAGKYEPSPVDHLTQPSSLVNGGQRRSSAACRSLLLLQVLLPSVPQTRHTVASPDLSKETQVGDTKLSPDSTSSYMGNIPSGDVSRLHGRCSHGVPTTPLTTTDADRCTDVSATMHQQTGLPHGAFSLSKSFHL